MKWISADYIKELMKNDRLMQGNAEYILWEHEVDRRVDAMPTIDPVKHGRWVPWKWYTSKSHDSWTDEWKCSECGYQFADKDWCYCPNCGARMDGGIDGETD